MSVKQGILSGLHTAGAFGFARRINRGKFLGATVLLYHRVLPADAPPDHYAALTGDPTAPQLEALIQYLGRRFRFSTPQECVDRWTRGEEVDPYTMLLTFDDGYADMQELLLPVLRKCRVPATVFVTTGCIAGYVTWCQRMFSAVHGTRREQLPEFANVSALPLYTPRQRVEATEAISARQRQYPAAEWERMIDRLCEELGWDGNTDGERMMSWEQVQDLHRSAWVTVGGHTVTHPFLDQCAPDHARREVFECAEELRSRLRTEVLPFSYPQGRLPSPAVQALVREAGYACAFTGRRA
jgi:peptidoglycan/xylan/chitin deacetylase (PgdA/CDA1 family)